MERMSMQSTETLLARVNRELERISDVQHTLARRKVFLQRQATNLRLGVSPLEVTLALRTEALAEGERTRLRSGSFNGPDVYHADRTPTEDVGTTNPCDTEVGELRVLAGLTAADGSTTSR